MPAQWTGNIVGKLHIAGLTKKQLATKLGLHEKYVTAILNGHEEPKGVKERFDLALKELIAEKES